MHGVSRHSAALGRVRSTMAFRAGGFTLIELIVVVVIMAVALIGIWFGIASIQRADIKAEADRFTGTVRYLYHMAAVNGRPYRLVIDLDKHQYWGEVLASQHPCRQFLLPDPSIARDTNAELRKRKEDKPDEAAGEAGPSCAEEERDEEGQCPSTPSDGFSAVAKDELVAPHTLARSIGFGGIMTNHQEDIQLEGQAAVHFFPNGYVERAYVYFSYGEEVYTVETFPLMGKAKVHRKELPVSDFRRDES